MDRKISFVQELNNQLKEHQVQRIILAEQKLQRNFPKLNQNKAKETLIDLGDLNQPSFVQQNTTSICRWNNRRDVESSHQNSIVTKRNNLLTERFNSSQNRLGPLRSYSKRQIPHLKNLLEKLSTPTNKKNKNVQERGAMTSVRRRKNTYQNQDNILTLKHLNNAQDQIILFNGIISERRISSKRTKIMQRKDSQNKNPILYPVNQTIKQKSRLKQYQRINRRVSNHWNLVSNGLNTNASDVIQEKQLLQNLIRNTISHQGVPKNVSQAALGFLGQYSNTNYFSTSLKNEQKRKNTLTNLLA